MPSPTDYTVQILVIVIILILVVVCAFFLVSTVVQAVVYTFRKKLRKSRTDNGMIYILNFPQLR